RIDFQVKIRGYRIELGDIDSAVLSHPGVRESLTVVDDSAGHKRLVGYYAGTPDPRALTAYLADWLPRYMIPPVLLPLPELPKNPNRKIDRAALPRPPAAASGTPAGDGQRLTALEREVVALLADVLGVPDVAVDDNFFDVGGHSLLAIRLTTRLRERHGVQLDLNAFFDEPTARGVARRLTELREAGAVAEPEAVPGPVALPRARYARGTAAGCRRIRRPPGAGPGPQNGPGTESGVAVAGPVKDSETVVATVMAGIAVILLSGVVLRRLALRVGQPAVIGELCAGLVLGPSLLGLLPGNPTEVLFPAAARPYLSVLAQVGVVLFVFLIGWEFNGRLLRGKRRVVVGVSLSSMAVPFLLGLPLALLLHRGHGVVDGEPVAKVPFVLYIGVVMSITAFPVLAKFLADRRMQHSPVGVLALASAAFGDALAWCSLAVVVVVVTAGSLLGVAAMAGWLALFLAVMVLAVRPLLARLVERMSMGTGAPYLPAVVGAGVLLSACATAWIGVHAIFGAFVFGLVMPRPVHPQLQKHALEPLEHVSHFLLPLFFIVVGLSIDLRAMSA